MGTGSITFRLAWRNLWRQPRRTWLTTGAMVFSNVLLVFLISLQLGTYGMMIDNTLGAFTGHLQVQAVGYKDGGKMRQVVPAISALAVSLRGLLDHSSVAARGIAFALVSSEERSFGVQIVGVEPEHEASVSSLPGLVTRGRFLQTNSQAEIVLGEILARNLKVELGDELVLMGSGRDGSMAAATATVVGILASGFPDLDRSFAEVSLGFFDETFSMNGAGHAVVVKARDLADVGALVEQARAALPGDSGLVVHDWDALQPGLKQSIQADLTSAAFTYLVLVVLVAFSVLNTQLMSVLERTREFGIVMALGVTPGRLGRLVMLETSLMGFLGFVLGLVFGVLLLGWFAVNGLSYPGLDEMAAKFNLPGRIYPEFTLLGILLGPSIVTFASIFSGVYPAWRLRSLAPVEAMRAT